MKSFQNNISHNHKGNVKFYNTSGDQYNYMWKGFGFDLNELTKLLRLFIDSKQGVILFDNWAYISHICRRFAMWL